VQAFSRGITSSTINAFTTPPAPAEPETKREVRSPNITQARRPLGTGTARAQSYGALTSPLRMALRPPLFEA
jgi:hypothetical protein